jgi:dTDP-4-dehydrorhamnose reductase
MLARALVPVFVQHGFRVTATDIDLGEPTPWGPSGPRLARLDVRAETEVRAAVDAVRPDIVLHLAAETNLEVCEKDPAHARLTNAEATGHVAAACARRGARLVYISTAGVFDGRKAGPYTEDDQPRPINCYGRTKFDGERVVAESLPDHLIVRAGWMVGGPKAKDHKFVGRVLDQLRGGSTLIHAVDDKFGSPTYAPDFAATLIGLVRSTHTGTFHSVSECRRSRYEVARDIVGLLGRDDVTVRAVGSEFFERDYFAARPRSEVLANSRLRALGLNRMRPWPQPLADYLAPWLPELAGASVRG